jgi:hypothetical protein
MNESDHDRGEPRQKRPYQTPCVTTIEVDSLVKGMTLKGFSGAFYVQPTSCGPFCVGGTIC